MAVLDSYLRPATTQRSRYADMASPLLWAGTFDLVKVTTLCREYFEWTHDEVLQKCAAPPPARLTTQVPQPDLRADDHAHDPRPRRAESLAALWRAA